MRQKATKGHASSSPEVTSELMGERPDAIGFPFLRSRTITAPGGVSSRPPLFVRELCGHEVSLRSPQSRRKTCQEIQNCGGIRNAIPPGWERVHNERGDPLRSRFSGGWPERNRRIAPAESVSLRRNSNIPYQVRYSIPAWTRSENHRWLFRDPSSRDRVTR